MSITSASITNPFTWTADKSLSVARLEGLIGASGDLQYLLDYLAYARTAKPAQKIVRNSGSYYTSSSTTWADVDATNLKISLTTDHSRVLIMATCYVSSNAATGGVELDIIMDSTTRSGDATHGLFSTNQGSSGTQIMSGIAVALFTSVTPGAHDWKLQFRSPVTGTATISNNGQPIVLVGMEL